MKDKALHKPDCITKKKKNSLCLCSLKWEAFPRHPLSVCDSELSVCTEPQPLDLDLLTRSISNLQLSPTGKGYVYSDINLEGCCITDVKLLCRYKFVRHVNIARNKITDLRPLSNMSHLLTLNASHNCIGKVLAFEAPWFLETADLSYNAIDYMRDLSDFKGLVHLNLSHNGIFKVEGLSNTKYLRHLDLSYNKINEITSLEGLRLSYLNLRGNSLSGAVSGLKNLHDLDELDVSENKELTSVQYIGTMGSLATLKMNDTGVFDLQELDALSYLNHLTNLSLYKTPLEELKNYRSHIILTINHLTLLDREVISVDEKAAILLKYDDNFVRRARRDHQRQFIFRLNNRMDKIDSDITPIDVKPYPIVIITGPLGSEMENIIKTITEKTNRIYVGSLTATDESDQLGYNSENVNVVSKEEFFHLEMTGKFAATFQLFGRRYGVPYSVVCDAAAKKTLLLIRMEIEGALSFRFAYPHAQILLCFPSSPVIHEIYLKREITKVMQKQYPTWDDFNDEDLYDFIKNKCMCYPDDNLTLDANPNTSDSDFGKSWDLDPKYIFPILLTPQERVKQNFLTMLCTQARSSLHSRDEILNFHIENPGVFRNFINTDDIVYATGHLRFCLVQIAKDHDLKPFGISRCLTSHIRTLEQECIKELHSCPAYPNTHTAFDISSKYPFPGIHESASHISLGHKVRSLPKMSSEKLVNMEIAMYSEESVECSTE